MSFDAIERLPGGASPVPMKHPAWWRSNPGGGPMTREWPATGFGTGEVDWVGGASNLGRAGCVADGAGFGETPQAGFDAPTCGHPPSRLPEEAIGRSPGGEPPDDALGRIVIATALARGHRSTTGDRRLPDRAGQGHVRAIPC